MRMFDNRNSWLDNEGKPLIGRVTFCKLHMTVPENIYNMNGTVVLANPQYTNTIGQLVNQVFLKDKTDYTVRFQKYVGNGDMTEDQDNWLDVYSCDDIWNTFGIEVDATTFQLVNNISDLRSTDPAVIVTRDNHKVIILGGYNEIGDKPQVMYIWNPTSIANDNGGSVIKVNSIATGRWELVNAFGAAGIDVRHFGVFGADSKQDATDVMSLQIGVANTYATSVGLPLYFPAVNGITWYKFNNLNIAGAKFAKETKVFGNSNTSSIITVYSEDEYLDVNNNSDYNAVFTIRGPVVKTSWGVNSSNCVFDPSYKLIVDSIINTYHKTFTDIIIDCQYEILASATFDNCQIHSIEKLGDHTSFRNCVLTENMFSDSTDFDTVTVYDSDVIDIEDWPTTSKWLALVTQNTSKPLDFRGRTVDSTCSVSWAVCQYRNAVFDNYNVGQTSVAFIGCSGTVNITNSTVTFIHLENSTLTFNVTPASLNITDYLYASNSFLSFGKNITMKTLTIMKSNVSDSGYVYTVTDAANVDNSTIQVQVNAPAIAATKCDLSNVNTTYPVIIDCIIRGTIYQYSHSGADINFTLQGNTFYEGGVHSIAAGTAGTKVVGIWVDNTSYCSYHFIMLNRAFLDPNEQAHTYTYEGNKGPHVLQRKAATVQGFLAPADGGSVYSFITDNTYEQGDYETPAADFTFNGTMNSDGVTDNTKYMLQFDMFTVGTQNVGSMQFTAIPQNYWYDANAVQKKNPLSWNSLITTISDMERTVAEWQSEAMVGYWFPKGYTHYSNYTWRITNSGPFLKCRSILHTTAFFATLPTTYKLSPGPN